MAQLSDEILKNFADKGRGYIPETTKPVPVSAEALKFSPIAEESNFPESPTLDQKRASTCLPHAFLDGVLVRALVQGIANARLFSILFLYRYGRPDPEVDSGMQFSNALSTLLMRGIPAEEHWPYSDEAVYDPPPLIAIQHAVDQKGKIKSHALSGSVDALRALSSGCPVVIGLRTTFGGPHAVLVCGHRRNAAGDFELKIKNSWGIEFGDGGYIWLPASLLDDHDEMLGIYSIDYSVSPSEDYADVA